MSDGNQDPPKKAPLGAELIIPVASVLFAIYYLVSIRGLPWEAQMDGIFLSTMIFITAGLFFIRVWRRSRKGNVDWSMRTLTGDRSMAWKRFGLVALAIVYLVVVPWLGFTLATFLFLIAGMAHLGIRSPRKLLLVSGSLAAAGYVLFIVALDSRLPHGLIENLLAPVVGHII